ncbi:Deoxyribonuclease-2-alpha [Trichinella zimbabwensis]|uniref:Deoxyribonuclease-2-alpha n=2 Tax=Trichinella zimbabwensis TaxID=268475 RepID=A0A0V1I4X3_9BILA|nr:Deoxyribonuclease-2-alpha [Trichinella zimbabwensis]
MQNELLSAQYVLYKTPDQITAKIITSAAPQWADEGAALTANAGHALVSTLESWLAPLHNSLSAVGYSNQPPGFSGFTTDSTSKGIIMMTNAQPQSFWLVHTLPKALANGVAWAWPADLTPQGHMAVCVDVSTQTVTSIASALVYQNPLIYFSNIAPALQATQQTLMKLIGGLTPILTPPFANTQTIRTLAAGAEVPITIFSKLSIGRLEMYRKILATKLKANIRVWAKTDNSLGSTGGGKIGFVKVVQSPITVDNQQSTREKDSSQWVSVEQKPLFCFTTNSYNKEQLMKSGTAICLEHQLLSDSFATIAANVIPPLYSVMRIYIFLSAFLVILHNCLKIHAANCTCRTATEDVNWFLLFKPVNQLMGILMFGNETTDGFWLLHTFERAFPNSASWSWPTKFTSEGHMVLCLSVGEDNVPLIVPALQYQEVVIYFGQVSSEKATEFADLTSLIDGSLSTITPPLWNKQSITTLNSALSADVYSKTASSRLEMYGGFLNRVMVVNMRIWAVTDNTLTTTCGGRIGFVKVVQSPVTIAGTQNDRSKDKSQWAVIEDQPVFCFTTNAYSTKQRTVAGSATCINQQAVSNLIFTVLVSKSEFTPWKTMNSVGERQRGMSLIKPQHLILFFVSLFILVKETAGKATNATAECKALVETLEGWIEPMSEKLSGFGYNNNPPSMTGMSTRSTSKGILMFTNSETVDEAFFFVYTMDGFLENGVGWVWPQALTSQGHMGVCMQISESDISSIATSLTYQQPLIYFYFINETVQDQQQELMQLLEGNQRILTPMYWDLQSITTHKTSVPINIYAKLFGSRLEMYSKLLATRLQANIRIWAKTDGSLTTTCGGRIGFVKVVQSPITIGTQQATRANDQSQWQKEMLGSSGAAVCLQQFQLSTVFSSLAGNVIPCPYVFYKAPGYVTAKISNAMNVPWTDDAAPLTSNTGHALTLTLDSWLVPLPNNLSALGYSNEPPYLSGIKTQSSVKGIIMMSNNGQPAFWFVHTFPRFLANAIGWTWPPALTEEGHMAVCMEVSTTTIQSIATSLTYQQPVIYFSNIDVALQPTQVTLMNLINGFVKVASSPFWHLQTITTLSREFYGRLLAKQLRANLRIWSRTDGTLTSTCGGKIGHVKLVKSPISIGDQQSRREADYAQWVSVENHPLFCFTTNNYNKEQDSLSGAGVCFAQHALSATFADMAKHVIPCPFS